MSSKLLGAVVLLGFPVLLPAQAHPERAEQPEVRTSATVERGVPADLATLTIRLSAQGPTPGEAGRLVAAKAEQLRQTLTKIGIARDSLASPGRPYWWRGRIETVPLPVRYVQRQTPTRLYSEPVQDTAYRANDEINVRIRDLSKIGAVLDAAMQLGITDISPVQFSATKVTAPQLAALRDATMRAHDQAQAIAEASGMTLGPVLSLSTGPDDRYDYRSIQLRSTSSGALLDGSGTTVVQPPIAVSVTVYGRWALVKKP